MNHYLFALLFILPAGLANAAPPIANKIPILNKWATPMDFGRKYRGERVFGKNKRWRGLLFGAFVGGVSAAIIYPLLSSGYSSTYENFLIGFVLGTGALLGDAIESFFKRQMGIKSGDPWFFFDQIDYVVGSLLFSLPFVKLDPGDYLAIICTYFALHLVVSFLGFKVGLKDKPI